VRAANGLIAVTPIFSASYSGLFKMFFDVVNRDGLAGKPTLIAATGGTPRHSLAIEHAIRPLFAYLNAAVVATGVYAATEDWGESGLAAEGSLVARIDRAAGELAAAMLVRGPQAATDPYETPTPFEELLRSNSAPD
jgi:FMN reductase